MGAGQTLRGCKVSWNGPPRHENQLKVSGVNVLSHHVTRALRKHKAVTDPMTHQIHISYGTEPAPLGLRTVGSKKTYVHWCKDFRQLDQLPLDATNAEIGEFSIRELREVMVERRRNERLLSSFPYEAIEDAIARFVAEEYSCSSGLSPIKSIDASPLKARFLVRGNCLETQLTMIFYLDGKELHRQVIATFDPGRFDSAKKASSFDMYDNRFRFLSLDMSRPVPYLRYDDLPASLHEHLPSNAQLHAAWGTPDPSARPGPTS